MTNIVICGVGGQGIILASNVLCQAAALAGLDVKKSEVHGMAQRGGTVITHVRFSKKVFSPLIEEGTADFILAFEKLETLRYLPYLKKNGVVIVNDREIPPMSVLVGTASYPHDIIPSISRLAHVHPVQADAVARDLGNLRIVNIVLLGVLARFLPFKPKSWHEAIRVHVKERFVDLNIHAFNQGNSLPLE
ncbi:indolepyruvate oxidoreductase subunit beta [candidate division WOR-3 bacterium]|nr:indolepyruvate oxidoreductase subunit beta [candidate division WOR-3 bacterium]